MILVDIVLTVMLSGPVWSGDLHETPEERRRLFATAARSIADAASETENPFAAAAVLIALGENETSWSRYVLEGRCMDGPRGMQCDYSEKAGRSLAIGPFQVHGWCHDAWTAESGSYASLLASARCALEYVYRGVKRCNKTPYDAWAGSFATYRGQNCSDGLKTGRKYKARKYLRSMIAAEHRLKLEERRRSLEFIEFIRSEYGRNEVAGNP